MNGNGTTVSDLRLQRAVALIPTVRRVQGGYRVASSVQDTEYLVTKPNGRVLCTCPNFRQHAEEDPGFQCKHILAVDMAYQDGRIPALGNGRVTGDVVSPPPDDAIHVVHSTLPAEDSVRLKLIKNTKGYSWEIAVADTDENAALSRLQNLEQRVQAEFGTTGDDN